MILDSQVADFSYGKAKLSWGDNTLKNPSQIRVVFLNFGVFACLVMVIFVKGQGQEYNGVLSAQRLNAMTKKQNLFVGLLNGKIKSTFSAAGVHDC